MKQVYLALLPALLSVPAPASAQEVEVDSLDMTLTMDAYQAYKDSLQATLTFYRDTTLILGDGLAELSVPEGYSFIGPKDAETVLVDMWGNMPDEDNHSYGMLFPDKYGPADPAGYGIDIFYTADGYIDDEDAADMDYDELLEQLQEETEEFNAFREAEGYQPIHLLGWATPPHYDADRQRLHWAKELEFEWNEGTTLNYNILFLGRRGYLTLNVIGGMDDLPEVNADLDDFLGSVSYTEGNRYADFNPALDEVAGYGIAALLGAKVLAKTGILATVGVFLLKAWKLIAVAIMGLAAGLRRFLGK